MGNKDCEINHYGIKGMKWGVRRSPAQLGHKPEKTGSKQSDKSRTTSEKSVKEFTREAVEKGMKLVGTIQMYDLLDDVFLKGKGKQAIGRAVTTAYLRANGYKKVRFM